MSDDKHMEMLKTALEHLAADENPTRAAAGRLMLVTMPDLLDWIEHERHDETDLSAQMEAFENTLANMIHTFIANTIAPEHARLGCGAVMRNISQKAFKYYSGEAEDVIRIATGSDGNSTLVNPAPEMRQ